MRLLRIIDKGWEKIYCHFYLSNKESLMPFLLNKKKEVKSIAILFKMQVDSYAYLPPNFQHSLKCDASATLVVFERRYVSL